MEQHPVPQQISSYEFRLVGDMTLKQFFQLGTGVAVALIIYASSLPWYFKWPLVLTSAFLGAAMAFVPFEERPLQTWIIAFFKAVYSPTQFLWQKKPKRPEFLETKPIPAIRLAAIPVSSNRGKLTEYLETLPTAKNPLDQKEESYMNQITNLFSVVLVPQNIQTQTKPLPENEEPAGIKIRRLMQTTIPIQEQKLTISTPPQVSEVPVPGPIPISQYSPPLAPRPRRGRPPLPRPKPAEFSWEIPIPSVPSIPNILVGMVSDSQGRIVEGAIMEIKDEAGNPVRALRTNKLGQFRIATPLGNGTYQIEIEKEGLTFDAIRITVKGEIVEPIEIKAKGGNVS